MVLGSGEFACLRNGGEGVLACAGNGAGGVFGDELWKQGAGAHDVWEGREFLEKAITMCASLPYIEVCLSVLGARACPMAQDKILRDSFLFS